MEADQTSEKLNNWLANQRANEEQLARAIAMRTALRVLPFSLSQKEHGDWAYPLALGAFRCSALAWATINFPAKDMRFANIYALENDEFKEAAEAASAPRYAAAYTISRANYAAIEDGNGPTFHAVDGVFRATDADYAAFADVPARGAFRDNMEADCDWLSTEGEFNNASRRITSRTLWPANKPGGWSNQWAWAKTILLSLDKQGSHQVWIDWYERRIRGEGAAFDIPGDKGRKEDKAILRRLAEATDEDFWGKGHEYVNATLKGWIDEARARCLPPVIAEVSGDFEISGSAEGKVRPTPSQIAEALERQASPQARIADGKLDAVPNAVFDKPQYSDNLATLPSEMMAFADVILGSLPRNCEPLVRNCFVGHRDELLVRGNRPILNILKGMSASLIAEIYIEADLTVSPDEWVLRDPREWGAGLAAMFAQFFKGHLDLVHHFPLDEEREELIAATPIDEVAASGDALTRPVDDVAALIIELGKQGFATDNIVRIVEAHRIHTRDIAQLPTSDQPTGIVTPKRRHVLQTAGFYINTYSVIGSTASLYALQTVPAFQQLLLRLSDAIERLTGFIL